ncbi:MAG: S9 family peptidase, partial [Bacteroidota bacterium]
MKTTFLLIPSLLFMAFSCNNTSKEKIMYPETAKVDSVDIYFGHEVPDPYRWLEDDNSEQTKAWVSAQNEVTNAYLSNIPYLDDIKDRLTRLWDYPRNSAPFKRGGYYFVFKNDGLQNQSVAYYMKSLDE